MDYYGTGRTNYVRVEDLEGLRDLIEDLPLRMFERDGRYAFISDDSGGSLDVSIYDYDIGEERYLNIRDVMPFIAEGEVLITMSAGNEGNRYVSGVAEAYVRIGDEIHETFVSLNNIYQIAADQFAVSVDSISRAEY